MATRNVLHPDPDARWFSIKMVASNRTMRAILEETIESAEDGQITESGRTACGGLSNMEGPLGRFPRAVDLAECPRDLAGTYHSHVTTDQLLNPTHSLPDMANVAFRDLDVSVVAGTDTADVLVASDDQEGMAESFRNVLGVDVHDTSDVVDAIDDGRIQDPPRARERVRAEFSRLFETHPTGFDDLRQRIHALGTPGETPAMAPAGTSTGIEPMYAMAYLSDGRAGHVAGSHPADASDGQMRQTREFRARTRRIKSNTPAVARSVAGVVANTTIGMATRSALQGMFSPRE